MDPVHTVMEYVRSYDRVCVNRIPANLREDFYAVWSRSGHAEHSFSCWERPFSMRFCNGQIAGWMRFPYKELFVNKFYKLIDYRDLMALYSSPDEPDLHISLQEVL